MALIAAELVWEVSRHYLVINELVPADSMLLWLFSSMGMDSLAVGNAAVRNQITYVFLIFVGVFWYFLGY